MIFRYIPPLSLKARSANDISSYCIYLQEEAKVKFKNTLKYYNTKIIVVQVLLVSLKHYYENINYCFEKILKTCIRVIDTLQRPTNWRNIKKFYNLKKSLLQCNKIYFDSTKFHKIAKQIFGFVFWIQWN